MKSSTVQNSVVKADERNMEIPPHIKAKAEKSIERASYLENLLLLLRILPAILDHISDIPVLIALWNAGYQKLFWIGIAIDLLPGPVTMYQFYVLGYRKKIVFLVCHPLNVFIYTIMALLKVNEKLNIFSRKVVAYCHESQALLESPLQLIFTVTLICHGILKAPWDKPVYIANSFGNEINLNFLPAMSVILSLISIIFNAGGTINLIENFRTNVKRTLTWILFLLSNIMFRLQGWTILATFLVEYVGFIILGTFLINLLTLLFAQKMMRVDPLLASVYSLVFPITFMKSVYEADTIEQEFTFVKRINRILALAGTIVMFCSLWLLYGFLPLLKYNPNIILSRDTLLYFMIATTILGGTSILSTIFISIPDFSSCSARGFLQFPFDSQTAEVESRKCKWNPNDLPFSSILMRVTIIMLALLAVIMPYCIKKEQVNLKLNFVVCNELITENINVYGYSNDTFEKPKLFKCPQSPNMSKIMGPNFELLACFNTSGVSNHTRYLMVDNATATFFPPKADKTQLVLISAKKENNDTIQLLRKKIESLQFCSARYGNDLQTPRASSSCSGLYGLPVFPADKSSYNPSSRTDVTEYKDNMGTSTESITLTGYTDLHYAVINGNVDTVKRVLDKEKNLLESKTSAGKTPIYFAAKYGYLDIVELLINEGAEVNERSYCPEGKTPMIVAAEMQHFDVLLILIDLGGANLESQGGDVMILTAKAGNLTMINFLYDQGIDVNYTNNWSYTPLLMAAAFNQTEVVGFLLDKNASVNVHDTNNAGPVYFAAQKGNFEMAQMLIEKGALVNYFVKTGSEENTLWHDLTPLQLSAKDGHFNISSFLLNHNASVNAVNDVGNSALHLAAAFGHEAIFGLLLDYKADIMLLNKIGRRAPHFAAIYNQTSVLKLIVQRGFNISTFLNSNGGMILHDAAYFGSSQEVIEYLLSIPGGRAHINFPDTQAEYTPLHLVCINSGSSIIGKLLLDHGAFINAKSSSGNTPLQLAATNGHLQMAQLLIEQGADIKVVDNAGKTVLHYAVVTGNVAVVKILLEAGVDAKAKDNDGRTAKDLAVKAGLEYRFANLL